MEQGPSPEANIYSAGQESQPFMKHKCPLPW